MDKALFWAMVAICVVILPLYGYVLFWLTIRNTYQNVSDNTELIRLRTEKLPPVSETPIPFKVFYINLDQSQDRRAYFEKQARELKLNYQRIPAVNGREITNISEGVVDGIRYTNDFPKLSFSELACTMSHLKSIRTAYDQKLDMAFICEDDISFELHKLWPKNLLKNLVAQMDPSIGILQLGWNLVRGKHPICQYLDQYKVREYPLGQYCWLTLAYLITRKGMVDVLRHSKYLTGDSVHLVSDAGMTLGVSDQYIYQSTKTSNCGKPILLPASEEISTTTIRDRTTAPSMDDVATAMARSRILNEYI